MVGKHNLSLIWKVISLKSTWTNIHFERIHIYTTHRATPLMAIWAPHLLTACSFFFIFAEKKIKEIHRTYISNMISTVLTNLPSLHTTTINYHIFCKHNRVCRLSTHLSFIFTRWRYNTNDMKHTCYFESRYTLYSAKDNMSCNNKTNFTPCRFTSTQTSQLVV